MGRKDGNVFSPKDQCILWCVAVYESGIKLVRVQDLQNNCFLARYSTTKYFLKSIQKFYLTA